MLEQQLMADQRTMERVESMRREEVEIRSISARESIREYEQTSQTSREFEHFMVIIFC